MASEVQIILKATDQASGVITKTEGALKGLNTQTFNLANAMQVVDAGMRIGQVEGLGIDALQTAFNFGNLCASLIGCLQYNLNFTRHLTPP